MITFADILKMLWLTVDTKTALALVDQCRKLGMKEVEYLDLGYDSQLPEFEKGYSFSFSTENGETARLEILEKQGMILQAGIQIIYRHSLFFSNLRKHYKKIVGLLNNYYKNGFPMDLGNNVKLINYGDFSTICYISTAKANNKDALTLKVGNAKFWNT